MSSVDIIRKVRNDLGDVCVNYLIVVDTGDGLDFSYSNGFSAYGMAQYVQNEIERLWDEQED